MAWLSGWQYRRSITIDNTQNASSLTDFQVAIVLDTAALISAGKMNADGSDIRVTDSDGVALLNYWIEDKTINTTETVVWARVPTIPAGSTVTIYLYYGNPTATNADGIDGVFLFADDFEAGVLDTNKWIANSPNYSFNNGIIYIDGNNSVWNAIEGASKTYPFQTIWYGKIALENLNAGTSGYGGTIWLRSAGGGGYGFGWNSGLGSYVFRTWNGTTDTSQTTSLSFLNLFFAKAVNHGNSVDYYYNGTLQYTYSGTMPTTSDAYIEFSTKTAETLEIDWVAIGKYSNPEPTTTVGAEEIAMIVVEHVDSLSLGESFRFEITAVHSESVSLVESALIDAVFNITAIEGVSIGDLHLTRTTIPHSEVVSLQEKLISGAIFTENITSSDAIGQDLTEVWNQYLLTIEDLWVYTQYFADTPAVSYQGDGEIYFVVTWGEDTANTYSYDIQRISLTTPTNQGSFVGVYLPLYKLKKTNQDTVIATIRLVID